MAHPAGRDETPEEELRARQQQPSTEGHEVRSLAQLKMLHALAARLNRLNDVQEIGGAITAELHTIIDYHGCRVYLLQPDGKTLAPIAFRGELTTDYETDTFEELVTEVGVGITGRVAATGESFSTPNARYVDFAVQIPGTEEIDESMLAVPLRYGDRTTGVIVLSSLGVGQFDDEDMRLLEVLASHAAGAFENARLLQLERESADTSAALLRLSQALTRVRAIDDVLKEALEAIPPMLGTDDVQAYMRDPEAGAFRPAAHRGSVEAIGAAGGVPDVPPDVAARFLVSTEEPFVLPKEVVATMPAEYRPPIETGDVLVAPLRFEPDGFGAIVIPAPGTDRTFSARDVRLARGIADLTSLALGNARRFHQLERFHELVEGLEAIFWETDARTLQFTYMSQRGSLILDRPVAEWLQEPRRWGDHVLPEDRGKAAVAFRAALEREEDFELEYRAFGESGGTVWLRDIVHIVRSARGRPDQLRGLIVDVTERKRAEQALQNSERTYSEAFNREREATRRLRALDEMKNTFLEAVSHELRTPLTSILGSALTLEQGTDSLTREDSADLVKRIAANARKLERLLSDLLDLDRLQRGILSVQRRKTDVGALVREAVRESDVLGERPVEVDAEGVVASVDPAKVERIVENLVANAARHTPEGARVWVRARAEEGGVLITVDDEGPGIPAEDRDLIFHPFRQGKPTSSHSPGVGVGLSLVARFAELHGGRAWVEDRPGGGASFRVLLPDARD